MFFYVYHLSLYHFFHEKKQFVYSVTNEYSPKNMLNSDSNLDKTLPLIRTQLSCTRVHTSSGVQIPDYIWIPSISDCDITFLSLIEISSNFQGCDETIKLGQWNKRACPCEKRDHPFAPSPSTPTLNVSPENIQ